MQAHAMIKFVYFDLGKVLVDFCHERMCRQMAATASVPVEQVRKLVFDKGLNEMADRGTVSNQMFHKMFCEELGVEPDFDSLVNATADIFSLKEDMLALVDLVRSAGIHTGILSNTCPIHWEFISSRFGELKPKFDSFILSFELGLLKPEAAIYQRAIEVTGLLPHNIFFVDDRQENVDGAVAAGINAVLFTSSGDLHRHLIDQKIPF